MALGAVARTPSLRVTTRRTGTRVGALDVQPDVLSIPSRSVVIKVGMVGDSQIGKTSLMVKYVEGSFDEDYIQTLGACARIVCRGGKI